MPDGTLLTLEDLKSEILEVLSEYSSLFYVRKLVYRFFLCSKLIYRKNQMDGQLKH